MVLSNREKFVAFYSMFLTTHIGQGVNPAELDRDGMGHVFNAVLETVRKSTCPDVSEDEVKAIAEDFNIEMFKIRTILDEAVRSQRLGDRV